eukprot:364968-Chlamydomonas_euryale.AAC.15
MHPPPFLSRIHQCILFPSCPERISNNLPPLPPSSVIAKIKAAAAAEALLRDDGPSREAAAVALLLAAAPPRPLPELPKGARLWCPALNQQRTAPTQVGAAAEAQASTGGLRAGPAGSGTRLKAADFPGLGRWDWAAGPSPALKTWGWGRGSRG